MKNTHLDPIRIGSNFSPKIGPKIGNDVVDLHLPETRSLFEKDRFLNRILAPSERVWMNESKSNQDESFHRLWMLWSAKEATYKACVKLDAGTLFEHSQFIVDPVAGRATYRSQIFSVDWNVEPHESVHCIAASGLKLPEILWRVAPLTQSGAESAEVRKLALALCQERGLTVARVDRPAQPDRDFLANRSFPRAYDLNGAEISEIEVSLSHHGRWIAAALSVNVADTSS